MVKSNKKAEAGAGGQRDTRDDREKERERGEIKMKKRTQAHWLPFPFYSCFSKSRTANSERGRKYKGLCSHFESESPTRTTETSLISPVQLYLCAQSFQNSNITPRDAVCLSAACLMESQKLTSFHCSKLMGCDIFPNWLQLCPLESSQRCAGPNPATCQPTASLVFNPLQSYPPLLLSVCNPPTPSPLLPVLISAF